MAIGTVIALPRQSGKACGKTFGENNMRRIGKLGQTSLVAIGAVVVINTIGWTAPVTFPSTRPAASGLGGIAGDPPPLPAGMAGSDSTSGELADVAPTIRPESGIRMEPKFGPSGDRPRLGSEESACPFGDCHGEDARLPRFPRGGRVRRRGPAMHSDGHGHRGSSSPRTAECVDGPCPFESRGGFAPHR